MKILKLNLMAFGPFTDVVLNLSSGQQGICVIYGPNEAGKSSSLRAITDFFYGIHSRTPDDFIHPYGRLRIGAHLQHSDGAVLKLVRRKANQNSLRLGDDIAPLDDSELSRFLGDVDRDLFETMFGIDHERLRRGGAEIVQGGGRIGELLFAAGAGLADLQKIQTQLQNEINQLLTKTGRSGSIVTAATEFKDSQKSVKELQVSVETWRSHDEASRTARTQKRKFDEAIRKNQSEQNRLTRVRDAVSAIARWRKANEDLAEVRDVPLLVDDFSDTSQAVLIELRKAEQQQEDAENAIATIDGELETVSIPEELLRESDTIESMRDRLGGHLKAMRDRPKLETSRELSESEAKEFLRKLGRAPDLSAVEELRLPADKTIRIQNLGNQQEGLIERLQSARRDCERIRRKIAKAESTLKDIRVPNGAKSLQTSVRDIQNEGDLESQLDAVQDDLSGLEQNAAVALNRLSLWSGSLEEVEKLAVPSLTTVELFGDELNDTNRRLKSLHDRLQEDTDAREDLESELRQLELEQKVPTKDELGAMRQLREQGWQLVLNAWNDGQEDGDDVSAFVQAFAPLRTLSEAYHRSVEESDQIADLLRIDADRVATKAKLQADKGRRLSREAGLKSKIEQTEAELRDIADRWKAIWEPIGIAPLTPQEMREWLRQQQEISQAAELIRAKQLESNQLQQRIDLLRDKLVLALKQVEPEFEHEGSTLRDLVLFASGKYDEIKEGQDLLKRTTDGVESDRSELADAESRFADSEAALLKWQSDWAAEMQRLGLEHDAVPSQANSVLTDISELFKKYQEADQFRTRIEGIDSEAREFAVDIRDLVSRVAPALATKPVEEAVGLLTTLLQSARTTADAHRSLVQRRNEQDKKRQTAQEQISEFSASLDEMCRQAGCAAYEQLSEAVRRSGRRRELEQSIRDYEEQIINQSGGADLQTFVSEAENEAADVDSLQPRIDELGEAIDHLGKQRDECLRQIEREESELRKIDGSALAAEQAAKCESLAARLEDHVQQLAVLRVSSVILHAGIEQYRKKNQGPVLGRASDIFSRITLHAFDGLRAEFNERGQPILTGVRKTSGETVPVSGMSAGTCDQLYLALRLASLETWLDHHEAIPFIVDDVLLNFDDDRAVASLHVLAELSHRTQVIFFTHHDHLVQMAKNNLSSQDLLVETLVDRATGP